MQKKIFFIIIYLEILIVPCLSCQSDGLNSPHSTDAALQVEILSPKTLLPIHGWNVNKEEQLEIEPLPVLNLMIVPKGMLQIGRVTRPRAYLRTGPGGKFRVSDTVLTKGAEMMVLASIRSWKKIRVMSTGVEGWIHSKAISPMQFNKVPLKVDVGKLPTVSTIHEVKSVESYLEKKKITALIPKGVTFTRLSSNDESYLVVVQPTRSVMWISKNDAR